MDVTAAPPRTWSDLLHWTYIGVDHKIPGNGGPECALFIGPIQRLAETLIFASLGVMEAYYTYRQLTLPRRNDYALSKDGWLLGRVLSVVLCLVFGMEIGYKLSTGQLIYLLNPCHLLTIIQIYLLTAPASCFSRGLFRVHMHILSGPLLAMIFPVTNTRMLPFETEIYYCQHILIYIIPYFLMRHSDVYVIEPMGDFTWGIFTVGLASVYHFIPLSGLSLLTHVNLNNMLCPAISDPFYGPWYRVVATCHQSLLMPVHGKLYSKLAALLLPADNENRRRTAGHKGEEARIFTDPNSPDPDNPNPDPDDPDPDSHQPRGRQQCNGVHNGHTKHE